MLAFVLNSFLHTMLSHKQLQNSLLGESQRFGNTSTLTEKHFTRSSCLTVPLSMRNKGKVHHVELKATTHGQVHNLCNLLHLKRDRQHSRYYCSHITKSHLLHKSHQTQQNKFNPTPNRVIEHQRLHGHSRTLFKKGERSAGHKPQQN